MGKTAWEKYDEAEFAKCMEFCENYRQFLSACKTERECVTFAIEEAEKKGYRNFKDVLAAGEKVKAGDKLYMSDRGKTLALFLVGSEPLEKGMKILGAHVDSPRLDLKQKPIYEDQGLVLFDTHYYGGIKKYQWTALPLEMRGVIVKKDGTEVQVKIGAGENDPVLGISDLLIHLAGKQMSKTASNVVEGEDLNVLAGSIPAKDVEKNPVKENLLKILKDQYDVEEDDFISAELEMVPAGPARDYGLDRSMIIGYGHDDRVCAYPSLEALLDMEETDRTAVVIVCDKEEIGSAGATGMCSRFFENCVAELVAAMDTESMLKARRALANSEMLSSDVSAAVDPNYPSVNEMNNSAFFGCGLTFNKYTGSRGKGGSNDAEPAYIAKIRRVMDDNHVTWQTAELGKVDEGGGGTIARYLAEYDMDCIDSGVAVQNMHAPFEVVSKADVWEAYKGYSAFLRFM